MKLVDPCIETKYSTVWYEDCTTIVSRVVDKAVDSIEAKYSVVAKLHHHAHLSCAGRVAGSSEVKYSISIVKIAPPSVCAELAMKLLDWLSPFITTKVYFLEMSFRLVLPPPVSFSEGRAVTRLETLNWIDCSNNNGTCNLYTISTVVQDLFGQKHYIHPVTQ